MFVLGPLSLSKTKWIAAIWDMNVEGSQWGSLGANAMEQALALVRRIPEQLPNLIASVRDPPGPSTSQRVSAPLAAAVAQTQSRGSSACGRPREMMATRLTQSQASSS